MRRLRLGLLLAASSAVFLLAPASQAAAFFEVTVNKAGSGAAAATVTSEPAGIDCGTECGPHNFGLATVKLTATPGPGDVLAGWSGASCDGGPKSNPCEFTLSLTNSADRTFTATFVPLPDPVQVKTGAAGPVGETVATMSGLVNPEGATVEGCRFEYGTTTAYGASAPCAPSPAELGEGSKDVPVGAGTQPLEPGLTYHYRLTASNASGATNGADMTFTTPGTPPCPNVARRLEQGITSILLPECMALELVSPAKKFNQRANSPAFSMSDDAIQFRSVAALAENPALGSINARYVATRTASGWVTHATKAPLDVAEGRGVISPPCSFSLDLSRWTLLGLAPNGLGSSAPYRPLTGGIDGNFSPLGPVLTSPGIRPLKGTPSCEGGSADASRFFFSVPEAIFLPGDPDTVFPLASENVYEAYLDEDGTPTVELLARDKSGKIWGGDCGTEVGGRRLAVGAPLQGAISPDGSRVYFTARATMPEGAECRIEVLEGHPLRILERLQTPSGPEISEVVDDECTRVSPPCDSTDGDDNFMGASQEGDKVFFTTTRQLADSDLDTGSECVHQPAESSAGCDLYLYDSSLPSGHRLIQVSAGDATDPTPGEGAEVLGVPALSGDGSHVYFVAKGVLTTTANAQGQSAEPGKPNLYLYERDAAHPSGRTAFIATLDPGDISPAGSGPWSDGGPGTSDSTAVPLLGGDGEDPSVGGDGHLLVFPTKASLLPADQDGGHTDAYRYDSATGSLQLISRAAPGGSENGPFDVNVAPTESAEPPQNLSFGRTVSEDGRTIGFATEEGLDPGDTDGKATAYIWHDGTVTAISGSYGASTSGRGLGPPAVSMSGEEVAFVSEARLVPEDGDNARDVYVARADGGFQPPVPPNPCQGEACQEPFRAQPGNQGTASSSFVGPGNPRSGPNCAARGHHARQLAQRAKRLRRQARRAHGRRRAKRLHLKARRLAKRAGRVAQGARRCRRAGR